MTVADQLLVSSVNGGGLFLVGPGGVERWSKVDTAGVTLVPDGALLARQAEGVAELRWLRGRDVVRVTLVERSLDLHDVRWHDGRIHVVATQLNTVYEFDPGFRELRHWAFPGEEDSQHVNSTCLHDGRLLATRFGRFHAHRGYKGATRGAGEVFDVETGEVLVSGLSQPHSLASHGGALWLCDSEARVLRRYRGFQPDGEFPFEGYVRGLAFAGGLAYVGLSRSRNVEDAGPDSACIVVLEREGMAEVGRIALPVNEVYDIRVVPADRVDDLRAAAFADAVAEYDTQVDARLRAVQQAGDAPQAEHFATALHHANLRIAELEPALASAHAELAQARRAHAAQSVRIDEDAAWIALLEADATGLRAHAARLAARIEALAACRDRLHADVASLRAAEAGMVARHNAAVAGLAAVTGSWQALAHAQLAHIQAIEGTRSWRWTRPLRRIEPQAPAWPGDAADAGAHGLPWSPVDRPAVDDGPAPDADAAAGLPGPPPSRADVPVVGLAFDAVDEPVVSILVASHGHFDQTRRCLESIRDAGCQVPFEVLLVEDASGEAEMDRFGSVPGLRYLRNPANLGYLRSVNAALASVRGEYVHLLNNDTVVQPGWLDGLLRTFAIFHDCGIAGSRLVYPDGRLQEAGGIVWADGRGCNVGRGDDPADPAYASVREVDYASAASVLLRTAVLRAAGGFDERYAPAYYEDTDLAFRLRERGLKTYYQPASTVIHEEGLSHGTDPDAGGKAAQERNRALFRERWAAELERAQLPAGAHPFLARSRAQLKKTILVADIHPPHTDRDAGSRAIWQLCRLLSVAGFDVRFWSHEVEREQRYRDLLAMHGVELVGEGNAGFEDWIAAHGDYLDYVLLSRPQVADAMLDSLGRHSKATVLYYGHDVHHLRLQRESAVTGDATLEAAARHVRGMEEGVWRRSDAILYPSAEETDHVQAWLDRAGLPARAETMPLFAFDPAPPASLLDPDGAPRSTVLFVGGFAHAPNADGIAWFADQVWPLVQRERPGLRLVIAGAEPTDAVVALAGDSVDVTGALDEAALALAYARARVAIAPLRFGAGVKGKVVEAMRWGVPCVVTGVGAQGLADAKELRVADDPAAMAAHIVALASDDGAWRAASESGQAFVRERYSPQAVWGVLLRIVDATPYQDVIRAQEIRASRPGRADI